jgi:hypothetical protein
MVYPVVTAELVQRIEGVAGTLWSAAMAAVREQPGNPFGVDSAEFGHAVAVVARQAAGPGWWNRVQGLSEGDIPALPDLLAFYRRSGARAFVDLAPPDIQAPLCRALGQAGLYPSEASTFLYADPHALALSPPPDGVEVREVGPEAQAQVAGLWAEGFGIPPDEPGEVMRRIRQGAFALPENRRYIALVGGQPAGMAALYVKDGVGFLNVGATLPPYRHRGCHRALTHQRLADALAAGCDLVIGHTGFGGTSQNNLERMGLRIAYNRISWVDGTL